MLAIDRACIRVGSEAKGAPHIDTPQSALYGSTQRGLLFPRHASPSQRDRRPRGWGFCFPPAYPTLEDPKYLAAIRFGCQPVSANDLLSSFHLAYFGFDYQSLLLARSCTILSNPSQPRAMVREFYIKKLYFS